MWARLRPPGWSTLWENLAKQVHTSSSNQQNSNSRRGLARKSVAILHNEQNRFSPDHSSRGHSIHACWECINLERSLEWSILPQCWTFQWSLRYKAKASSWDRGGRDLAARFQERLWRPYQSAHQLLEVGQDRCDILRLDKYSCILLKIFAGCPLRIAHVSTIVTTAPQSIGSLASGKNCPPVWAWMDGKYCVSIRCSSLSSTINRLNNLIFLSPSCEKELIWSHPTPPPDHFSVWLLKSSSNWNKLSMMGSQLILDVFRCSQLFFDVFSWIVTFMDPPPVRTYSLRMPLRTPSIVRKKQSN